MKLREGKGRGEGVEEEEREDKESMEKRQERKEFTISYQISIQHRIHVGGVFNYTRKYMYATRIHTHTPGQPLAVCSLGCLHSVGHHLLGVQLHQFWFRALLL